MEDIRRATLSSRLIGQSLLNVRDQFERLLATHRRKVIQKLIKCVTAHKVVKDGLDRDSRSSEDWIPLIMPGDLEMISVSTALMRTILSPEL